MHEETKSDTDEYAYSGLVEEVELDGVGVTLWCYRKLPMKE